MAGIQTPVGIDTVNPVPADYKYGPYATTSAAIAAIPLALRYDGLTVQITGAGNYWWLASDLSDSGLIVKSGGGSSPIVRNIYLLGDASDVSRMGGAANGYYSTAQSAYNAAVALIATLGGSSVVNINVGVTVTSRSTLSVYTNNVGDITLTANWNRNITLCGINPNVSAIGNIIGTNASGGGFSFGTNSGSTVIVSNIRIGNISTNATGTTGNSGSIGLIPVNSVFGNFDTSITNASNTTGNGGNITIIPNGAGGISAIGTVNTSSKSTTSSAGALNIITGNLLIGNITTANNNLGGNITISTNSSEGILRLGNLTYISSSSANVNCTMNNCNLSSVTMTLPPGSHIMTNCYLLGNSGLTVNITGNGLGSCNLSMINCSWRYAVTLNDSLSLNCKMTSFNDGIISLGNNSVLSNCALEKTSTSSLPVINGIGTGCKVYNCTLLGGNFSISNGTAVTVIGTNTVLENPVDANVTVT